jgi:hypothetical protein
MTDKSGYLNAIIVDSDMSTRVCGTACMGVNYRYLSCCCLRHNILRYRIVDDKIVNPAASM